MDRNDLEAWTDLKKILVILAHPDDPEFFCGGTIARWAQAGHIVRYCLLTHGEKGVQDVLVDAAELGARREIEQRNAADVLGVESVRFLNYEDGCLQPDLVIRESIVKIIREERPDILVTSDPTNFFPRENRVNHPDHRIAGQIVLEAAFPASGNPMYYHDQLELGLRPHQIEELWLTLTSQGNIEIDVTHWWEQRISALKMHQSQIPDTALLEANQRKRRTEESSEENPKYVEKFRRIVFQ